MSNPSEAWLELTNAIETWNHGDHEDLRDKKALQDAVFAYARLRDKPPQPTGVSDHRGNDGLTLPFGRSKGRTISEAATDDLQWILPKIRESVDAPDKARWRDANLALADAIEAELERR